MTESIHPLRRSQLLARSGLVLEAHVQRRADLVPDDDLHVSYAEWWAMHSIPLEAIRTIVESAVDPQEVWWGCTPPNGQDVEDVDPDRHLAMQWVACYLNHDPTTATELAFAAGPERARAASVHLYALAAEMVRAVRGID